MCAIIIDNFQRMQSRDKVKIGEKFKVDFTYLKDKFTNILEEESSGFDLDINEKNRFKTMGIEYLNLIMKLQKEFTEYVDSDESHSEEEEEEEEGEVDELFEEKNKLLQKALLKKIEQNRKTTPSQMNIDLDIAKPEHMFILKNGVEVPVQSQLDFSKIEQFPKKIQQLHERQHYYCNFYKELLSHQRWLCDKKN